MLGSNVTRDNILYVNIQNNQRWFLGVLHKRSDGQMSSYMSIKERKEKMLVERSEINQFRVEPLGNT